MDREMKTRWHCHMICEAYKSFSVCVAGVQSMVAGWQRHLVVYSIALGHSGSQCMLRQRHCSNGKLILAPTYLVSPQTVEQWSRIRSKLRMLRRDTGNLCGSILAFRLKETAS